MVGTVNGSKVDSLYLYDIQRDANSSRGCNAVGRNASMYELFCLPAEILQAVNRYAVTSDVNKVRGSKAKANDTNYQKRKHHTIETIYCATQWK